MDLYNNGLGSPQLGDTQLYKNTNVWSNQHEIKTYMSYLFVGNFVVPTQVILVFINRLWLEIFSWYVYFDTPIHVITIKPYKTANIMKLQVSVNSVDRYKHLFLWQIPTIYVTPNCNLRCVMLASVITAAILVPTFQIFLISLSICS